MAVPDQTSNVLFLTHNYPRSADDFAGRFIARLAGMIQCGTEGLRVAVLAPHAPGAAEAEQLHGVCVRRFRYAADADETLAYRGDWHGVSILGPHGLWATRRFFARFARDARQFAGDIEPRLVHAHWWVPAGWIALGLDKRFPVMVTLHGSDLRLLQTKRWMRPLAARVFRRAGIVTTVSTWLASSLAAIYPWLAPRIRVAPMPADDQVFTPAPGTDQSVPEGPPVILAVTRFTAQKQNDVLLDALALLQGEGRFFACRIAGEGGSLKYATVDRIAGLGLAERVTLLGALDQKRLAGEYRRAAVTVLTAVNEGFGMALVEAQLCGCPVIGARSGGITDIITDGETGLLFEAGDAAGLAKCLGTFLDRAGLRSRLARQGTVAARRTFSAAAIAGRFRTWYDELSPPESRRGGQ